MRSAMRADSGSWLTITRRAAVLADELAQHLVDLVGGRGVELARRLVGEEDRGRCASAAHSATRCCSPPESSVGPAVALRGEPDALEQLVGAARAARAAELPRSPSCSATRSRALSSGASARA